MSRIGIKPIPLPEGVTAEISRTAVVARGPKGENTVPIPPRISVEEKDATLVVSRQGDSPSAKALHGLVRSLVANAVNGAFSDFSKTLEIQGVGFRAKLAGEKLELTIGFSHPVVVPKPEGIAFQVKGNKIAVLGRNKAMVGEIAANIRRIRPPDAYKGKGIRYEGELVKLKPGKTAKTGA